MDEEIVDPIFSTTVRSIPPKTQGNRGYFPSSKVKNGVVNYESQIERDFYFLLDHADDVKKFQPQPVEIWYKTLNGKTNKYTPDVYVEFSNGIRILVELKDEDTFQNEKKKFEERWNACKIWAEKKQMDFIVLTDYDIRNSRLSNIWFTLGSSKQYQNDKNTKKLLLLINSNGTPFNDLCKQFAEDAGVTINKSSQIICYAIYHGIVFVDTYSTDLLYGNTILRKRSNKIEPPFKPLWAEFDEILESRDDDREFEIKERSIKEIKSFQIFNIDEKIDAKEQIVKEFLKTPSEKRNKEWRVKFQKKYDINIVTVYRWVKKYEERGIEGLLNQFSKRGRKEKWDLEALEYLERARIYYLKPNVSYLKAYDDKSTAQANKSLTKIWKHNTLHIPSISTFKRYIKDNTSYSERIQAKEGKRRARSLKPSLRSFRGAIMPMQVLQFDNTPFDMFLTNEYFQQSIGTPNLCAAIDCYTRMITGFELTLNAINRQCVLETLVQSITNKARFLDQIISVSEYVTSWDIEGFPVLMLVDNAMEYRSEDVEKFCLDYDIILEFAPLKTPRFKAYIENWFSILKGGLAEELTEEGFRPSLTKRIINPDLNPEKGVIFNFQRMEKWLTSWILDEYHFENPYNDGLLAPYLRFESFQRGEGNIILPLPREAPIKQSNKDRLVVHALMSKTRKLKTEISFENLKFSAKEIIRIWNRAGETDVKFHFDFRDIRTIWVKSPIDGKPIALELSQNWASAIAEFHQDKPISLSAWRKEIREIKKRNKSRITPYSYRKEMGRMYREQLKEDAKQDRENTKTQLRIKETDKENQSKIKRKGLSPPKSDEKKERKKQEEEIKKPKKKWKKREVDWSKVKELPSDKMYKG